MAHCSARCKHNETFYCALYANSAGVAACFCPALSVNVGLSPTKFIGEFKLSIQGGCECCACPLDRLERGVDGIPRRSAMSAALIGDLISWVNSTALTRAWTLRTSIAVLGLGVATMPIAFLQEGQAAVGNTALVGAGLWLVTEIGIAIWADSST